MCILVLKQNFDANFIVLTCIVVVFNFIFYEVNDKQM